MGSPQPVERFVPMVQMQWRKAIEGIEPITVTIRIKGTPSKDLQDLVQSLSPPVTFRWEKSLRLFIREGCGYCYPVAAQVAEVIRWAPTLRLDIIDADRCTQQAREAGIYTVPTLKIDGQETLIGLPSALRKQAVYGM